MMRQLALWAAGLCFIGCAPPDVDLDDTRGSRVDVYFNDPGARVEQLWTADAVRLMVELIENARVSIDLAVMGFSHPEVVDAFEDAWMRGVDIQMVGDAGHLHNHGYQAFADLHIPVVTGNLAHIMHDKFMVVDESITFASTANWTPTDLVHNNNNFVIIESPFVAEEFLAEHAQMFGGVFGHEKPKTQDGRSFEVGDTTVEVWFSPNQDAMGRILQLVDGAQERVSFTIFAFTKDQVGSSFIQKHQRLVEDGLVREGDLSFGVSGVVDKSQLHSNGQYHEVYRLMGGNVPMRLDGNDASQQPGDYQAGGGRLHTKTMVIDPEGENPMVISGSFNWSASATQSNDEFMVVLRGRRVARDFQEYFDYMWRHGEELGIDHMGETGLSERDIVFSEVHWYGVHPNDPQGYDEFIELRNRTSRDIRLDMWQITGVDDFVVGIPPGSVIPAGGTYTIVDHVLEPYQDGAPQDSFTAFLEGDQVVNAFNDDRQARLYLKDGALELFLLDPRSQLMDTVGDGGPAFHGGPVGNGRVRSMVRLDELADGATPEAWGPNPVNQGRGYINPAPVGPSAPGASYQDLILATPGEVPER